VKKRNNTRHINEIASKLVGNPKIAKKFFELDVIESWNEVIGKNLKKYVLDIYLKDGSLIVKFESSVVRNELSYKKQKIIQDINTKMGEGAVKEIILR
tara:strand:+ start:82 stop:375 length:294 start_codon:yes stop_codon:yes gene_type:complete